MPDDGHRNLLALDNARNLTRQETVRTFVPTPSYSELLVQKNQVVLGSRGSGKTALLRMLSHSHMSACPDKVAQDIIASQAMIGLYVPMSTSWVSSLKNKPWQSDDERQAYFVWRLNLSTCRALTETLRSCLDTYVVDDFERTRLERALVGALVKMGLSDGAAVATLKQLDDSMYELEYRKQVEAARALASGVAAEQLLGAEYAADPFEPLKHAIHLANEHLGFSGSTSWLVCLDEIEFLDESHHRILNTFLRSHSGDLVFKMSTLPYHHHTLKTSTNASLNVGHDFTYLNIDRDPIADESFFVGFAESLYEKRMADGIASGGLHAMLGESALLDDRSSTWGPDSEHMALISRHANAATIERAQRLQPDEQHFQDEIARKMHGSLLLREEVSKLKGHQKLKVYAGLRMLVRCSDGNPRRLVQLLKRLIDRAGGSERRLTPGQQTDAFVGYSRAVLERTRSEPVHGIELYELLVRIGEYFHYQLHDKPLATDVVGSFELGQSVTDANRELIKEAIAIGLVFPNSKTWIPEFVPHTGDFRLAYVLAPQFRLLPRRGKTHQLSTILSRRLPEASGAQTSFWRDECQCDGLDPK